MLYFTPYTLALVACLIPSTIATDPLIDWSALVSMVGNAESQAPAATPIASTLHTPTETAPAEYVSPVPWKGGEYVGQPGDKCGEWGCGAVMPTAM